MEPEPWSWGGEERGAFHPEGKRAGGLLHRPERRTGTVAAIGGVGQRQNVNRKRMPFTKRQKKAPRPGLGEFP